MTTLDQPPLSLDPELLLYADDLEALMSSVHPKETVVEDISKRGASPANSETTATTDDPPDNLEPLEEFDDLLHLQASESVQALWPPRSPRPELEVRLAFHQRSEKQVSNAPMPMLMFLCLHLRFCVSPPHQNLMSNLKDIQLELVTLDAEACGTIPAELKSVRFYVRLAWYGGKPIDPLELESPLAKDPLLTGVTQVDVTWGKRAQMALRLGTTSHVFRRYKGRDECTQVRLQAHIDSHHDHIPSTPRASMLLAPVDRSQAAQTC